MQQIRFDDLAALKEHVTEEWSPWGDEIEITMPMILEFADLTGDHQWIHVDVERANAGPFGGPLAHGFLTMSVMPRIRPPADFEVVGHGNVVNYGCDGFRFLAPVLAGDKLHARARLLDVRYTSADAIPIELEFASKETRAVALHGVPDVVLHMGSEHGSRKFRFYARPYVVDGKPIEFTGRPDFHIAVGFVHNHRPQYNERRHAISFRVFLTTKTGLLVPPNAPYSIQWQQMQRRQDA